MYQHLFNLSKQQRIKQDLIQVQKKLDQRSQQQFSPSKKTYFLNRLNKFNKLEEIFHQLDGDHDGVISARSINIKNVPIEVLEVISPLLIEMEDASLELNIEEFIIAADKFIKVDLVCNIMMC